MGIRIFTLVLLLVVLLFRIYILRAKDLKAAWTMRKWRKTVPLPG